MAELRFRSSSEGLSSLDWPKYRLSTLKDMKFRLATYVPYEISDTAARESRGDVVSVVAGIFGSAAS